MPKSKSLFAVAFSLSIASATGASAFVGMIMPGTEGGGIGVEAMKTMGVARLGQIAEAAQLDEAPDALCQVAVASTDSDTGMSVMQVHQAILNLEGGSDETHAQCKRIGREVRAKTENWILAVTRFVTKKGAELNKVD